MTCSCQNTPFWPLSNLNLTRRMCLGSCMSKNYRKIKFHIQSAKLAHIQLINWYFVLTFLNPFWVIYWNKRCFIWKCEYSANKIKNEIGNDIIRGCMRLKIEWLDLYGTPCKWQNVPFSMDVCVYIIMKLDPNEYLAFQNCLNYN